MAVNIKVFTVWWKRFPSLVSTPLGLWQVGYRVLLSSFEGWGKSVSSNAKSSATTYCSILLGCVLSSFAGVGWNGGIWACLHGGTGEQEQGVLPRYPYNDFLLLLAMSQKNVLESWKQWDEGNLLGKKWETRLAPFSLQFNPTSLSRSISVFFSSHFLKVSVYVCVCCLGMHICIYVHLCAHLFHNSENTKIHDGLYICLEKEFQVDQPDQTPSRQPLKFFEVTSRGALLASESWFCSTGRMSIQKQAANLYRKWRRPWREVLTPTTTSTTQRLARGGKQTDGQRLNFPN